mgnify:CR=1 FL=1
MKGATLTHPLPPRGVAIPEGWNVYAFAIGGNHVDGGAWFYEPEDWDRRRGTYSSGHPTFFAALAACHEEM